MSSILAELMSEKVKENKIQQKTALPSSHSGTLATHDQAVHIFDESLVSVYRYSGFALHSIVENKKSQSDRSRMALRSGAHHTHTQANEHWQQHNKY